MVVGRLGVLGCGGQVEQGEAIWEVTPPLVLLDVREVSFSPTRVGSVNSAVVRVTNAIGQPAMIVGGHGTEHGTFWNPTELLIDDRDRVIVLDHGNHRLQAFDLNGDWLMTFGTGRAYTPRNTPSMRPQDTDDE